MTDRGNEVNESLEIVPYQPGRGRTPDDSYCSAIDVSVHTLVKAGYMEQSPHHHYIKREPVRSQLLISVAL